MPALLKGFLDRVFREGVVFEDCGDSFRGLLTGRTAQLVFTLDTPKWVYHFLLRAPCIQALKQATLIFCGVSPIKTRALGPVRGSSQAIRQRWLDEAHEAGRSIERDFYTGWRPRLGSWLTLGRLHFFPFPWLALSCGAVFGAVKTHQLLNVPAYVGVCVGSALGEFLTVITNEIHDLDTDSINRNAGPFTGGSRVLVNNRLHLQELRAGRRIVAALIVADVGFVWTCVDPFQFTRLALLAGVGLWLGMQYSAPPLRLSRHTLGEIDVAFSHSILVILVGYFSQASAWDLGALLLGVPTFFAVLPSIILAGFPDFEADERVHKRTLAVALGRKAAGTVAVGMVAGSVLCYFAVFREVKQPVATIGIVTHALLLSFFLARYLKNSPAGRIDSLIIGSLTYMVWFVASPLLHFWHLYRSQH